MKSIMEEASTISKAIETAWNRAGQPQEFTVKILELPKTSFFGLKTSKSAKIAFFFTEVAPKPREFQPKMRPQKNCQQQSRIRRAPEGRHEQPSERLTITGSADHFHKNAHRKRVALHRALSPRRTPHQSQQPQRPEPRPYEPRSSESRESWAPEMVMRHAIG